MVITLRIYVKKKKKKKSQLLSWHLNLKDKLAYKHTMKVPSYQRTAGTFVAETSILWLAVVGRPFFFSFVVGPLHVS